MTKRPVSAVEPDWSRELPRRRWDPGVGLVRSIRDYQKWRGRGRLGKIFAVWCVLRHHFWSAVSGADIQLNTRIGGGLVLLHPNGIVIHPDAEVGPNCIIFQQVAIAMREDRPGCPRLGGDVSVGAGAKLLGAITIGDHARIGANAVVLTDVPAWATAVGAPARVLERGPRP